MTHIRLVRTYFWNGLSNFEGRRQALMSRQCLQMQREIFTFGIWRDRPFKAAIWEEKGTFARTFLRSSFQLGLVFGPLLLRPHHTRVIKISVSSRIETVYHGRFHRCLTRPFIRCIYYHVTRHVTRRTFWMGDLFKAASVSIVFCFLSNQFRSFHAPAQYCHSVTNMVAHILGQK